MHTTGRLPTGCTLFPAQFVPLALLASVIGYFNPAWHLLLYLEVVPYSLPNWFILFLAAYRGRINGDPIDLDRRVRLMR